MGSLREKFDRLEVHFKPGGRWERFYPVYEMVDTFVFAVNDRTVYAPHVRAAVDMKRVMTYVVLATIPAVFMSWLNTGYQMNLVVDRLGLASTGEWRGALLSVLGIGLNPANPLANILHGMLYFFPVYIVTLVSGGVCEVIFSVIRKHEVNEGFLVTSMLYTLTMPPGTPLWQVSMGIIFGVVIGKELFGGTGKNFMNPALVGRAFLYFAYPATMSGDRVWLPVPAAYDAVPAAGVDAYSGQTALARAVDIGHAGLPGAGFDWWSSFLGLVPGSLGETSALAIGIGLVFLLATRIANYRLVAGMFLGIVSLSLLCNVFAREGGNPLLAMPWYWHMVIGGAAFGMAFMVTEPVSAASTQAGRWVYGFLVGALTVIIRVINPAFPEGVMLAILFGNVFAPLIDYAVLRVVVRRRRRRFSGYA